MQGGLARLAPRMRGAAREYVRKRMRAPSAALTTGEPMFQVSELFSSLQGEGPHAGRPSVFLRLGTCNLSCVWCDTPYTWLFSEDRLQKVLNTGSAAGKEGVKSGVLKVYDKHAELRKMTAFEVLDSVRTLAQPASQAVVITGGEPLLHAKPLNTLVPMLLESGFDIEFETNGTIRPHGISDLVHFNVSPKLRNSEQSAATRLNYPVLSELMSRPRSILKFVVDADGDIGEVLDIVDQLPVTPDRVYLMPQGKTTAAMKVKGAWVAELCRKHGFNYAHRVHVELWGDTRGT